MTKNNKKKIIITGACGTVVIGLSAFAGYEYGKYSNNYPHQPIHNIAQAKKINYADKISTVVVSEITEDGYATLHGDHSHFVKGLVPYNAKILESLVYKDDKYVLKDEDIQYELAQGYVIKVNGKFYYYPKKGVTQTNVVDEKTAREITAHSHHHSHSEGEKEDNYTFNPKDIVSETADGYVVRHGDHFHYIKKSDLTAQQLAQAKKHGVNTVLASSTAGITTPTSDGYIFKGERDIIGRNSLGFIVRHGNHQHFIPYSQLRGTKWEYLLSSPSTPSHNHNNTPSVPSTEDNYTFNPKDVVSEDENGYIVKHGDHYHYIPKKNNNSNNGTQTPDKPKPNTPTQDDKKDFNSILKFPGIHFTTSDGFLLSENDKITTTSSGISVKHGKHEHFIYYYQLVNSKFENLIPSEYKDKAKDEYAKLEQEVTKKINYLARKNNADAKEFHFVVTNEGNAIEFKGKTTLLKDIVIDNTADNTKPNDTDEDKSLQEKINYLAKSLNIDPSTIKVIDTDKGKALVYPHGDHSHTILAKDIDTSKPIEDPHHNAGADTLKKLGFDDDIIHDIQHASADTDFPTHETDTEKMKEWLKTVKYLNIGQNKDPLKRKGLDLMPNIEVLGVGFTPIDDITPVYKFKKLRHLYVSKTGIKDYSFIKNIPTLEGIDFSENDVDDISFLKDYPNLKLVAAAGNNIKNIDVLKNLKNLESLNLDNNKISDISALKDLTHLKAVSLENNNITKLDAFNNKPELSRLFLSNNGGLELATLKNNNLEQLTVNNCNIRDLSVVSNLPKLKNLVANNNKISTLSHLKNAKSLDSVEVNNNNIDRLDFENNTITSLEIKNNKLDNINNIHKLTSLENLDASDNEISELPTNKHNKLVNLTLSNNKITTLENVNNLTALKYLTMSNNYVSTLVLKEKNKTLEYLDISHNNISKEELTIPSGKKIPKGIADNFEKVDGGDVKDNYTLSADYITNEAKKLQEEILKLKNEKKLDSKIADELKQKARLIDLDITYSIDKSKNKLISLEKQLNEIRKDVKERLTNNQTSHNNDNQGNQNSHHDENEEHKFEFDVNNIIREEGDGYIVKHGDHNHFVKKSDLTAEQLEQAKKFLANKENGSTTTDKETLAKKKNYIALFYGIKETDIKVENNTLVFNYKGTVKRLVLSDITVPAMSDDLEADFEKEITALATSMNTTVEHIQVQDGQMIVNHGDHNHYYPIKSPGWRLYNQNKIPYIEIPKVKGTIDEAVVNNKITELENKAKVVLAKNPAKLRKVLAWLNNFREVSLAWHVTATDGYLQALATFEKTQLNG
ncbi:MULTISPECIES: pneumococcal-type histidine triad protein [Gemella]|uniref:pneumococcal-type histidine triad protein n=1 Tax=Gemella TaxID=1378 RepID=UPI0007682330|nr:MULTISPECIES: pneumococcal-type histidine triad protein [Gemella]AME09087.1 internalin [Gemella sp. oral taxon 928]